MNEIANPLLVSLGRTTLWLALAAFILWGLLRLSRTTSPLANRMCCILALLVGWTFLRVPFDVPWYAAEAPSMVELAAEPTPIADPQSNTFFVGVDPQPLPAMDAAEAAAELTAVPLETAAMAPSFVAAAPLEATAFNIDWPAWTLGAWALGIAAIVGVWLMGYVRFVRTVVSCQTAMKQNDCRSDDESLSDDNGANEFDRQWQDILQANHVRRRIPLQLTDELGPMLCRLHHGYRLLIPLDLWSELDAREREAILRHELAHYLRGDVWKSLVVRVLALPHWFNPLAWLCVRRFEEAAEWACDRLATAEALSTDYAKVLVRLGAMPPASLRYGTAARGRPLADRVRRLLTLYAEDSTMKKITLVSIGVCLLAAALVRVQLVAKAREADEPSAQVLRPELDDGWYVAVEDGPTVSPYLNLLQAQNPEPERTAPVERPQPAAPPARRQAAAETQALDQAAREMVLQAKQAYEATLAAYQSETATMESVYGWSTRWMNAEAGAARDQDGRIEAVRHHLDRMKQMQERVEQLYKVGSKGGDAKELAAANYYVAEAKRRLLVDTPRMPYAPQPARTLSGGSRSNATGRSRAPADRNPLDEDPVPSVGSALIEQPAQQPSYGQPRYTPAPAPATSPQPHQLPSYTYPSPAYVQPAPADPQPVYAPAAPPTAGQVYSPSAPPAYAPSAQAIPGAPSAAATPAPAAAQREPRYNGKNFDEWVEVIQNDLSPVQRAEAVAAISAFSHRGYSRQVAHWLAGVMSDYPIGAFYNEGLQKLRMAADQAAASLPRDEGVLEEFQMALKHPNANVRSFAMQALYMLEPKQAVVLLTQMAKDPDANVRVSALNYLQQKVPKDSPRFLEALKSAIDVDDPSGSAQITDFVINNGITPEMRTKVVTWGMGGMGGMQVGAPYDMGGQTYNMISNPPSTVAKLIEVLAHGQKEYREAAIAAIIKMGPEAIGELEKLSKSLVPTTAREAAGLLDYIQSSEAQKNLPR